MKCSKCKGDMENGIIAPKPIFTFIKKIAFQIVWGSKHTGSAWVGGYDLENESKINTYKCKNFGYLESYAK